MVGYWKELVGPGTAPYTIGAERAAKLGYGAKVREGRSWERLFGRGFACVARGKDVVISIYWRVGGSEAFSRRYLDDPRFEMNWFETWSVLGEDAGNPIPITAGQVGEL